ncbi:NlpC/P60 family protein [Haemophilus paraphrohaemolyticus HK411]|uniref:NlpC/P60 family protein n=2 Tax=Haemophilus paraphrohaemolyticus TaxID=736 RepID=I2NK21_9PAST|nr:NlpC/P60 family protein [Haemophilus paraphrohaemolyticus HK411]
MFWRDKIMNKKFSLLTQLKLSLFVLFAGLTFQANASLSSTSTHQVKARIVAKAATAEQIEQNAKSKSVKVNANQTSNTTASKNGSQKVNQVYRQWVGTRYHLGGTGVGGIDCSAFVQKTMSGAFNIHLPRSTAEQRYSGRSISKSDLQPGDLVFFRKNNHVGVYIGGGKFVHASTSQGVTTSSLSESYWSRTYTQSRRVL